MSIALSSAGSDALLPVPHAPAAPSSFTFGRFVLQPRERRLQLDGQDVELGSRAFDILLMLVESDGALVTKDAILDQVWTDITVEENNIQVQISALRRVFGADRAWIVTVPGRGYRFTAPVLAGGGEMGGELPLPEPGSPPPLSVLVLPLAARGDDAEGGWYADSLTDVLTADLARNLPGCTVSAHTTADLYKGRAADIREIGQREGVRFVLEGSILLTASMVRVTAQLIEVERGACVWPEHFDKPRGTLLQDQDEIAARLSRAVGLQMVSAEARRAEQAEGERPGQLAASEYIMRGRALAHQRGMTRHSNQAAYTLFQRALELEPGNNDALANIASLLVYQVINGFMDSSGHTARNEDDRGAALDEAGKLLAKVLTADPDHSLALQARAVLLRARGSFEEALAACSSVLARNRGNLVGHREMGLNLLYLGRAEEAAEWFRRADTLAPNDPMRWAWMQGLGRALMQLGRDAEAVDALRLAIDSNPNYAQYHALLAAALALCGAREQAQAELAAFRQAEPDVPLEAFARRSAVPYEATDPLYRQRNERILHGLRLASET